jgi:hypothetical protein
MGQCRCWRRFPAAAFASASFITQHGPGTASAGGVTVTHNG